MKNDGVPPHYFQPQATQASSMSGEDELEALLEIITKSARQAIAEYKKSGESVPTIRSKAFHPMDFVTDTVALKKAVRVLEGACQQLCASLAPPQHTIINFGIPFEWACMRVVVRAKVADALEKHPDGLHIDKLAKMVNLDQGKLARVLRLLATKGCFTEVEPNTFSNNRLSLVTASSYETSALSCFGTETFSKGAAVLYETMTDLEYATSDHPTKAPIIYALKKQGYDLDGNFFDFLKADDEKREIFHRAMVGVNPVIGSLSILHHYPWNEVETFCDVGAGAGAVSLPLSRMYPHLKIINQDLPEVIAMAKDIWSKDVPELLQNNRVEFVPLDFFQESPVPSQDVYYLRNIIHDWRDAEATNILRSVRKAMAPHSRLLIHCTVLNTPCSDPNAKSSDGLETAPAPLLPNFGNGNNMVYQRDFIMWFVQNAKERTLAELTTLGATAELQLVKVYDLACMSVLEFMVAP